MEIRNLIKLKNENYKYFTEEECLAAVKRSGYNLQYVKNQTEEMCKIAVCKDLDAVRYINIDLKPEVK